MHNEALFQFIWQHKLFDASSLTTINGKKIIILNTGVLNIDSGPDFFNARIKIGSITLAGNVELHVNSSDWLKHKHNLDKSYNNIILHVVYNFDKEILQNKQNNVEILELKTHIQPSIISKYNEIISTKKQLPCINFIEQFNKLKFDLWLRRMCVERMEHKINRIKNYNLHSKEHLQDSFYILFVRSFGFSLNNDAFEFLAKNLPLSLILKYSDNLLQVLALFYGCAGFLEDQKNDKRWLAIQNEFEFLRYKHKLIPIHKEIFKNSKTRPGNFPHIRIAQLAVLVYKLPTLFSEPQSFDFKSNFLKENKLNEQEIKILPNELIGKLNLTQAALQLLLINAIAPFLFFYGKRIDDEKFCEIAFSLLEHCNFELNRKTKQFPKNYIKQKSSFESQALINLYDNYCTNKKCLKCSIGIEFLMPKK